MKQLRWPTTREQSDYMKIRQQQNLARCTNSRAESWMHDKLKSTGLKWTRQAQWGYRLFDFWNGLRGIAVEVDGPEHDREYDAYRDEYNFRRSAIVVLRVANFSDEDAARALRIIGRLGTIAERKAELGISGPSKKARRVLAEADIDDGIRLHIEYIGRLSD